MNMFKISPIVNPQEIYFLWEEFLKLSEGENFLNEERFNKNFLGRLGWKKKPWLFSFMDYGMADRVYFKDWISATNTVCRGPVAEVVSMVCKLLCRIDGGKKITDESVEKICKEVEEMNEEIGGNLSQKVLHEEMVQMVEANKNGGETAILFETGGTEVIHCCVTFLTRLFSPYMIEMESKLKRSVTMSLNIVCITRNQPVPKPIQLLCDRMVSIRETDEKCAVFAPETMHKQRNLVEAICNAFLHGWAPMDGVPVPVLLMVLRTYLRNFAEPLFTLHLSRELISSCSSVKNNEIRLERLKMAYTLLPKHFQQSTNVVVSAAKKLICNKESLDSVSRVLGYCLLRTESKASSTPSTAIELTRLLVENRDEVVSCANVK